MFADAQGAKMYCRMAYMHKKTLLQVEGEFFLFCGFMSGMVCWRGFHCQGGMIFIARRAPPERSEHNPRGEAAFEAATITLGPKARQT